MAYETITRYRSPNYTVGRRGNKVQSITIHHWGVRGQRFDNVARYLCRRGGNSSAHYVVEAGRVACLVDPNNRAWHAGNGRGNNTSIGIECRPEATPGDYQTVAELITNLRKTYGPLPLVPHSHWTKTACPGVWDLARLDALTRGATPAALPTKPLPQKTFNKITTTPQGETEMFMVRVTDGRTFLVQEGCEVYHIPSPAQFEALQYFGIKFHDNANAGVANEAFTAINDSVRVTQKSAAVAVAKAISQSRK